MKIHNRTITTVVSDFDGTLIRPGMQEPGERFFRDVEELLSRGVQFIAASGRQYPNLKRMLAPVADRIGFIAENGTLVVWQGRVLHKCTIAPSAAERLIRDMKEQPDSEILISGEGTSYIVPNSPQYAYLLEHQVKNVVKVLTDFSQVPEEMLKISIYYPAGIPAEAECFFHARYDKELLVVESGNGWLDFMPKNSGKGNALKMLADIMGFDLQQTVAFGDSENDISMLQTAGIGYAMSFAREKVRAAADDTCDSVEEVLEEGLQY